MAGYKVADGNSQLAVSKNKSKVKTQTTPTLPPRKRVHFPQVKGKVVQDVEFTSAAEDQSISINFRDNTCLHFGIVSGFTLKTHYTDFKTGEARVIRTWKGIRSN